MVEILLASVCMMFGISFFMRKEYLVGVVGSLICLVSLLVLYTPVIGSTMNMYLVEDGLSGVLIVLSCFISFLMSLVSAKPFFKFYLVNFWFIMLIYILNMSLLMVFCVNSIMWFYVFFEASLIPVLFMILGWGYQPERLQAGMYMMMYTICGSLPFLFMICFFYMCDGHLSMFGFRSNIGGLGLWWVLLFGVFLIKLPVFFVHLWLPKAHVEAPLAGSMVLAAVLLKLGGYGMMRMMSMFKCGTTYSSSVIMVVGLLGGVFLAVLCMRQLDMKSLIAYSSVCHMSMVLGGMLSNTVIGWKASVVGMISHGFCSSGLFVLANLCYEKVGSRSILFMGGMFVLVPQVVFFMFMFSVINSGIPPFVSFLSELMLSMSIFFYSYSMLLFIMFLLFFSFVYNMYLYTSIAHGSVQMSVYPGVNSLYFVVLFMHLLLLCFFSLFPDILFSIFM